MDTNLKITIIAAVADNGVIGNQDDLPWKKLREDMRWFKRQTEGKLVVAGRRTHESILNRLGKPLPDRRTIVLTSDENYVARDCAVAPDWGYVKRMVREANQELFVIGGAKVYAQAILDATHLMLTRVHASPIGDTLFPRYDQRQWKRTYSQDWPADAWNEHALTFELWERKAS